MKGASGPVTSSEQGQSGRTPLMSSCCRAFRSTYIISLSRKPQPAAKNFPVYGQMKFIGFCIQAREQKRCSLHDHRHRHHASAIPCIGGSRTHGIPNIRLFEEVD
jgi:hypothetical protein